MNKIFHIPVLLEESVKGLAIKPNGVYVDATYGGGGHAAQILKHLDNGKLIAFDQDVDTANNVIKDKNLIFIQHNFRFLRNFLDYYQFSKIDGILADLGVSSHDFDEPERGFSFRFDGTLDMRMNQSASLTAKKIINEYDEEKLAGIFREYGEISNARKTASVIINARINNKILTTHQLCGVIEPLVPPKTVNKYLAQVFQALRIEVNNELEVLKSFLADAAEVLDHKGRLVVISYHSLEDRLVKNFINKGDFSGEVEKDFYGNVNTLFKPITKKAIVPSNEEIDINPRARSAKLRIAERI